MLTREATYEDYGFSEDEDKRLGEFCKNLEMRDKILLLQCAAEVYPNIVDELYCWTKNVDMIERLEAMEELMSRVEQEQKLQKRKK